MNEYRVQRLKEDLTYSQQRNKQQKKQLANYKKVHEKDLKEIERLNKENNELIELYRRTCNHLFSIGNDELARYFQAQINECPIFITQGSDKE